MSDLITPDDLPDGPGKDDGGQRPTWLGRRPDSGLSLYSLGRTCPRHA